jgi:hypothetical protein
MGNGGKLPVSGSLLAQSFIPKQKQRLGLQYVPEKIYEFRISEDQVATGKIAG